MSKTRSFLLRAVGVFGMGAYMLLTDPPAVRADPMPCVWCIDSCPSDIDLWCSQWAEQCNNWTTRGCGAYPTLCQPQSSTPVAIQCADDAC
jgi:hypothetical protein